MSYLLRFTKVNNIITMIGIALTLYILYSTIFGYPVVMMAHRSLFLAVMLIIFFTVLKPLGNSIFSRAIDGLLILLTIISNGYIFFFYERILNSSGGLYLSHLEIALGLTLIIICLEAARRTSVSFFVICVISVAYTLFGKFLPGILQHAGMDFYRAIYLISFTSEGIFGVGVSIASGLLFMFILFGSAMEVTGVGDFFIRLANSVVGGSRGGSGKAAVVGSSLMGSVMGNATANVIVTGTFTIPLMIKAGFKKRIAAAIECLSSEGGQYLPPIMGASAFIMAQVINVPYSEIVVVAIIPAIMYYFYAFYLVDNEAAKNNLKGIPRSERVPTLTLLKKQWYLLVPLIVGFYTIIIIKMTPIYAAMVCVILTLAVTQIRIPFKGVKPTTKTVVKVFDSGVKNVGSLIALMAGVGLIQQAFVITGLGARFANILVFFSDGNKFILLLIAMLIAIILGMGMPTPVAYLLCALFVAPALVQVGIPVIAAHLFLLYIAVKSGSTPPVGVVAMVAAGIAKADFWKTSITAFLFSVPTFVLAFSFVYHPELLLLEGNLFDIAFRVFFTMLSLIGFSAVIQGYFFGKIRYFGQLILAAISIMLLFNGIVIPIIGLALLLVYAFKNKTSKDKLAFQ